MNKMSEEIKMTEEDMMARIKELEEDVKYYKEHSSNLQKQKNMWLLKHSEESILKTKYKMAYDVLFDKITDTYLKRSNS